jgi:hypothetical protein
VSRRGWRLVVPAALVACLSAGAGAAFVGSPAAADTPPAATTTPSCPTYNPPNTMTLVAGAPQSAKLGEPYATDLQVSISNTNGCPVTTGLAGVAVTFAAPSSGPSGRFASSGANAVLVGTNAAGVAAAPQFTANHLPGGFAVVASSDYGTVGFFLVNTASGVPATISTVRASQSAAVGSRYAQPLEATVMDADGNPVEGVPVTFALGANGDSGGGGGGSAAAAGASFSGGGTQATETTDSSGVATSPTFTANSTAGKFTASAATAGIAEPVSFTLANVAGKPPRIGALAPAKQSATVNARYRKPLRVRVLGGNGKPLPGASVTFTLGSDPAGGTGGTGGSGGDSPGASFVGGSSQVTATTDADGIATTPAFTANTTAGRFTATATTAGTTQAASFSLDNLAGKPPTVTLVGNGSRSAVVGDRYREPLEVKVRDGSGKALQGATVTFTLGSSGGAAGGSGSGSEAGASFATGSAQATATTNAAGIAISPALTANTTAGSFTASAATSGNARVVSFALRNLAGSAAAITPGAAATESISVGTRFPIRLAVTITDTHQNPVAGVAVTFAAPARGPSGRFAGNRRLVRVKTDAKGVAIAPALVANKVAGGWVVRATAAGHSAAFALVNQPAG